MSRIISTAELKKTLKQLAAHHGRQARLFLKFMKEDKCDKPLAQSWARDARRSFLYEEACATACEILDNQPSIIPLGRPSAISATSVLKNLGLDRELIPAKPGVPALRVKIVPAPKPLRKSKIENPKSKMERGVH